MEHWLKLLHSFPRNPKVRALSRFMKCGHHAAMGLCVQWLLWVDEQSAEGETQLTPEEVDEELNKRGATAALVSIGWAEVRGGLVFAVDYGKHCGESAKKRAQTARRVEKHRSARNAESVTAVTPKAWTEEEEEYNNREVEVTIDATEPPPPPKDSPNLCPPQAAGGATAPLFPEECKAWLRAIVDAVPAFSRLRTIPRDSQDAIVSAWHALPSAADQKTLAALACFYAASDEDVENARLWRPQKFRSFFLGLHDVLTNAERYARRHAAAEAAAAKAAAAKAAKAAAKAAAAAELERAKSDFASLEDQVAFLHEP